jgi:hypothetical protein
VASSLGGKITVIHVATYAERREDLEHDFSVGKEVSILLKLNRMLQADLVNVKICTMSSSKPAALKKVNTTMQ